MDFGMIRPVGRVGVFLDLDRGGDLEAGALEPDRQAASSGENVYRRQSHLSRRLSSPPQAIVVFAFLPESPGERSPFSPETYSS